VLDLTGRAVLVVGAGRVASRRVGPLLDAGARVRVVAPRLSAELDTLVRAGAVTHRAGDYRSDDLDAEVCLVHAATSDPEVNARVAADAAAARIWCVRADDAAAATAHAPALARGGDVTVAVHGGTDPGRARAVRDAVAGLLAAGGLPVRRTRPGPGRVALVGGGPGDPGLLTVRGRQLLAEADVVVVDKLAPRRLLAELDPRVEVVDAGKSPHAHNLSQSAINELLVERARRGLLVVRLKGGDPFVFGRGGEEVAACAAAGVSVEVVPGVTSAVAVPAAAGIPVTHRGLAQEFTVVSAHLAPGHPESTVDWAALARLHGTLVLLMAVGRLPAITAELRARGRAGDTPVAVVAAGTTENQRVVRGSLDDIAALAADIEPPAVVVVGAVAGLRLDLRGVGDRPGG
jgi:uroporphyrin-III C-methyltransferase/precorrin-2 dehydrogenase/sirohydrochlorin ferrochelatase